MELADRTDSFDSTTRPQTPGTAARIFAPGADGLSIVIEIGAIVTIAQDAYTGYQVTLATVAFYALTYSLCRAGYYELAVGLTLGVTIAAIFILPIFSGYPFDVGGLDYLVLPILLGSYFFSRKLNAILIFFCVAGMLLFPILISGVTVLDVTDPISLVLTFSVLIILLTRHRNMLERDRQQYLDAQEIRYRGLLEIAFDGVCVISDGKIINVNPSFSNLFGYKQTEVIGMPVLDCFSGGGADLILQPDNSIETIAQRKDNSIFMWKQYRNLRFRKGRRWKSLRFGISRSARRQKKHCKKHMARWK